MADVRESLLWGKLSFNDQLVKVLKRKVKNKKVFEPIARRLDMIESSRIGFKCSLQIMTNLTYILFEIVYLE